jgi:hypothetical protein
MWKFLIFLAEISEILNMHVDWSHYKPCSGY